MKITNGELVRTQYNYKKETITTIIADLALNKITGLFLECCNIQSNEIQILLKALKTTQLQKLSLCNNPQIKDNVSLLCEAVKGHNTLTFLDLNFCDLSDENAIELGGALACNNSLITLYLSNNLIGDKGAQCLIRAVRINTSLRYLSITADYDSELNWNDYQDYMNKYFVSLQSIYFEKGYCSRWIHQGNIDVIKNFNSQREINHFLSEIEGGSFDSKKEKLVFTDVCLEGKEGRKALQSLLKAFRKVISLNFFNCGVK